MSILTDWIKYDLYPALFECINQALPELNFERISGDWHTALRIDGTNAGNQWTGKTFVTKKVIGRIFEQGGENISIIDYVMRRDGVDFLQAVKTLAEVAGLQLPDGEFHDEAYQRHRDRVTILEEINSYFINYLNTFAGKAWVWKYLYRDLKYGQTEMPPDNFNYTAWAQTEIDFTDYYSRGTFSWDDLMEEMEEYYSQQFPEPQKDGYTFEDVKTMEFGSMPQVANLIAHLHQRGYSKNLIDEAMKQIKCGHYTHELTIPYRSGGTIKGFQFISANDSIPKYINTTWLVRVGGFFNLLPTKGDKDIVIVERELDSLIATARGVDNVVAAGGSSISSGQIKDAIRRGAKSFTLCFDNEPDKEEETAKNIQRAVDVILGEGVSKVYIATLPHIMSSEWGYNARKGKYFWAGLRRKTDPDTLIREVGIEAFKAVLAKRLTYGAYLADRLLNEYFVKQADLGKIGNKDRDNLQKKIVEIRSSLSPLDMMDFNGFIEGKIGDMV